VVFGKNKEIMQIIVKKKLPIIEKINSWDTNKTNG